MKKLKIGITGGIGAGKSFVCDIIEKSGFKVIHSDLVAKEVMNTDESVKKRIMKIFGNDTYINGKLNNQLLAQQIFTTKERIEKINSVVHPPTIRIINTLIERTFQNSNIVFVESALIYEAKIYKLFDYIILVYSDEQTRINRVVSRDKTSSKEILSRMKFQSSDEKKKEMAHFVIENNSTLEQLQNRTLFILNIIRSFGKQLT